MSSSAGSASNLSQQQLDAAATDPKLANVLYHDWEAASYDSKWNITWDQRCIDYARGRFDAVVPGAAEALPYGTALELGCGTGFFLLNLMQSGVAAHGILTDISPGMVKVATGNAQSLGLSVTGKVADAETIPVPDGSVDLVVGHAVLHHIPDVELAFTECLRVLRPGGRFVFAGEPTIWGDRIARRLSRATWWATTTATRLPALQQWARPREELDDSSRAAALEAVVDLHTFDPGALAAGARSAGAQQVSVVTEELSAAWLGWPVRTFEAAVPEHKLGRRWALTAMRGWHTATRLDEAVLRRVVPSRFFYNALITGTKAL